MRPCAEGSASRSCPNTPQVLLLALKLVGIGFWSLTISKIIKSVTTLSNPASVAYAQVRVPHERMH